MEAGNAPKVKCVIGMIHSEDSKLQDCFKHLQNVFGPMDMVSKTYDFDSTDYYHNEMGKGLKRTFISFEKLIEPQMLPDIKRITNIIEIQFSINGNRLINLDPGYLDMDKFVLASAKYGRQKIYLDKGIYADPTLYFFKKQFHSYSWSFPDFASGLYHAYFQSVRELYKEQIRQL